MSVAALANGRVIERKLRRARRRYVLAHSLDGAAEVVLWAAGLGAVSLAVDYTFHLEPLGRLLLVVVYGALLLVVVGRWLLGPLVGAPDDDELALKVEAQYPELSSALISAVQLSRVPPGRLVGASPRLVEALQAYTAERAGPLNFTAVMPLGRSLLLALLAGVVALGAWGFGRAHGAVVTVWADRFLHPLGSTLSYPTRTQVEVLTGGRVVPRGEDVEVSALARGEVPRQGTLHFRAQSGGWQQAELPPVEGESGRFATTLERLLETTEYYVELGDGRSDSYELRVVPRPRVTDLTARYQLPAYAGGETRESVTGDVDVLVGTWVTVTAATNKPVVVARLELDGTETPMTEGPDGRLRARFQVAANGTYCIRLRDGFGLDNRDPIVHLVRALEDRAPRVRIRSPGRNKDMTPIAYLPIHFEVWDDFGVTEVQLRYAVQKPLVTGVVPVGGPPEEAPTEPAQEVAGPPQLTYATVPVPGAWRGKRTEGHYVLELEPLALEEGDTLLYHVRVADNRQVDPRADDRNWADSREYEIRIVSPRSKREELRLRQEEAMREIQLIIDKQENVKEAVELLLAPPDR